MTQNEHAQPKTKTTHAPSAAATAPPSHAKAPSAKTNSPSGSAGTSTKLLAIVRIRGDTRIVGRIKDTLDMLHIGSVHYCTVVPSTPSYVGMIKKVQNHVTYGEISDALYAELVKLRGEKKDAKAVFAYKEEKNKQAAAKMSALGLNPDVKPFFRLSPPRKGYGRKGIKKSFNIGGVSGYRGPAMEDLLKRMM